MRFTSLSFLSLVLLMAADDAKLLKPVASVRVGRNPTFVRLQFDWNVDTKAKFTLPKRLLDRWTVRNASPEDLPKPQ